MLDKPDKNFENQVTQAITQFYQKNELSDPDFTYSLVAVIIHCFHLPFKELSEEEKAKIILNQLFYDFTARAGLGSPFQLLTFLRHHSSKKTEVKSFLIAILYGLYYGDISLPAQKHQDPRDNLEFLMFQILAENVSIKTLRSILIHLTIDKKVTLICYLFRHYREGSFIILNQLDSLKEQESSAELKSLILGLRRKYFDRNLLHTLLLNKAEIVAADLPYILNLLEEDTTKKTKEVQETLNKLIPEIIESPMQKFRVLDKMQKKIPLAINQQMTIEIKQAEEKRRYYLLLFQSFINHEYTYEEMLELIQLFGLVSDSPPLIFQHRAQPGNSLLDKVKIMENIFRRYIEFSPLDSKEKNFFIAFIASIVNYLEALHLNPLILKNELNRWTCALPTCGRVLEELPVVHSAVKGLQALRDILNKKLPDKINLENYPIFIFDQSDSQLFAKNTRFIRKMSKNYKCSIIQISKTDALELAKKLSIEFLINTTGTGQFGYGGARNCIFFLTPVLKQAFLTGKKTIKEILEMDHETLRQLFQKHVLGKEADAIFMFDDDMEISDPNFLIHLLFAATTSDRNAVLIGYSIGRVTKRISFPTLESLLKYPYNCSLFLKWRDEAAYAGMSEHTSKPRFCLNIPYGSEEAYCIGFYEGRPLFQPSYHLASSRFPSSVIPTHPFVGIETKLKSFLHYTLEMNLIRILLDPVDLEDKCVFPWNNLNKSQNIQCLSELLALVACDQNKKTMMAKFWKNVSDNFSKQNTEKSLEEIFDTNLLEKEKLDYKEKKSLQKIEEIYQLSKKEKLYSAEYAYMVIETLRSSLKQENWIELCAELPSQEISSMIDKARKIMESKYQISFPDHPRLLALYRIFHAVGAGEFNEHVKHLLKIYGNAIS